ncbi:MAG: hypothetical protein ACJ71L_02355, partial [Nitrososphaeraceae archaeon]
RHNIICYTKILIIIGTGVTLTEDNLAAVCKEIQHLDTSVRFVGIANNRGTFDREHIRGAWRS